MDKFWEEFETGEIHFRDKWQFELKSEFFPISDLKQSEYIQEFFIFIPNSLQINSQTYTKSDFYHDQTNLIRFKTPDISFTELVNPHNHHSPLTRLMEVKSDTPTSTIEFELKLFANIFRSNLRKLGYPLIFLVEKAHNNDEFGECKYQLEKLLYEIGQTLNKFDDVKNAILQQPNRLSLQPIFGYIKDMMSISLNSTMTGLLEAVRSKQQPLLHSVDQSICQLLTREKKYRESRLEEPSQFSTDPGMNESILYQSGLLNKFTMDALQLQTKRLAVDQKFRTLVAGMAAAVAMLLFLLLYIWQGAVFVINSLPFVIFTVVIYVLKDRLKEELKNLSYKHMVRWFPDYTTEIRSPSGNTVIGKMHESFTFMESEEVSTDIWRLRNEGYHTYLDMIKRPEQVIYYKKIVGIYQNPQTITSRLQALNIIFRHDIHKFLAKGSNPYEPYVTLDPETLELTQIFLPKVYHINIILKNTYLTPDLSQKIEYKKFRLVVDKDGIKRIESLSHNGSNSNGKHNLDTRASV